MNDNKNTIEWFWAHRRNASLHHMSFLMKGLSNNGWMPVVNFAFDHQIVVGVPDKGCYVFYDKNQLNSKTTYKDIQNSIDANQNFVQDFRRRTDEIFGAIFFKSININLENLSLVPDTKILEIYNDFMKTIMVGPIITVQLWGIEACFDENYKIVTFLKSRLKELGKEDQFEEYKNILAANSGETVAFTEKKNFYEVAIEISKNNDITDLFKSDDIQSISKLLRSFEYENGLLEKHIAKYEWVNTEYVSGGWSREQWLELFVKAIISEDLETQLQELLDGFKKVNQRREEVISELNPPVDVKNALSALSEFIAQRDWTKGYFTRVLLSYNKLLAEIAKRLEVEKTDLLFYSYIELADSLEEMESLDSSEIQSRKEYGFAMMFKGDDVVLKTSKEGVDDLITEQDISSPFEEQDEVAEFKGMSASRGIVTGKARVLEDAQRINELEEGEVLVTYMTTIEFIPGFRKASAVVTDEGGMSCHAAIISREFGLPCVVGTQVATRSLKTGDLIEVNGDTGVIKILEKA